MSGNHRIEAHSDDAALLQRWRDGDGSAGQDLFQRYYDLVQRFFINKVSSGASDLVQKTFMACVINKDRVEDRARFRSYLFSIAYHVLLDEYRARQRKGTTVDLEEDTSADLSPSPSSALAAKREHRLLLEALRHIPIADQVVLEMHYWEQMSMSEIAEVMSCPRETMKGRVWRARRRLEEQMARLAESPGELHSTRTRLEDWAADVRGQLDELRPDD